MMKLTNDCQIVVSCDPVQSMSVSTQKLNYKGASGDAVDIWSNVIHQQSTQKSVESPCPQSPQSFQSSPVPNLQIARLASVSTPQAGKQNEVDDNQFHNIELANNINMSTADSIAGEKAVESQVILNTGVNKEGEHTPTEPVDEFENASAPNLGVINDAQNDSQNDDDDHAEENSPDIEGDDQKMDIIYGDADETLM